MLYFVPINCQFLFRSNSIYYREGCFASVQSIKRQGMKDQNLTMKSEQTRAISSCVSGYCGISTERRAVGHGWLASLPCGLRV